MKPAPFKYIAASSVAEALALKAEHGDEAKFLAGGQSLMPAMNFRLARPSVLIDLNDVADLSTLHQTKAAASSIGAMVRYRTLERDAAFRKRYPLVADALPHIAHPQIRNRGTIGGNLCHADPASELPAIMLALHARLHARSSSGERWIEAADFFRGLLNTALRPDEMLVAIELPAPMSATGSCFLEIARRRGDFAIAGVAALLTVGQKDVVTGARLTLCGIGDTPLDVSAATHALIGQQYNEGISRGIAAEAQGMIDPAGSVHATADYQRHVAGVLIERALAIAAQRAHHDG